MILRFLSFGNYNRIMTVVAAYKTSHKSNSNVCELSHFRTFFQTWDECIRITNEPYNQERQNEEMSNMYIHSLNITFAIYNEIKPNMTLGTYFHSCRNRSKVMTANQKCNIGKWQTLRIWCTYWRIDVIVRWWCNNSLKWVNSVGGEIP